MKRLFVVLLLFAALPVFARDNGQYSQVDPSIKSWIKGLRDKRGISCCDTADGYPAEAEWDTKNNNYRVLIEGEWYVVPDDAVIDGPNKLGFAVVWWYPQRLLNGKMFPVIRCFLRGSGT